MLLRCVTDENAGRTGAAGLQDGEDPTLLDATCLDWWLSILTHTTTQYRTRCAGLHMHPLCDGASEIHHSLLEAI